MDLINSARAKRSRRDGMTYRDIADQATTNATRIKRQLADAPKGRRRRELRDEIAQAGGLQDWWGA